MCRQLHQTTRAGSIVIRTVMDLRLPAARQRALSAVAEMVVVRADHHDLVPPRRVGARQQPQDVRRLALLADDGGREGGTGAGDRERLRRAVREFHLDVLQRSLHRPQQRFDRRPPDHRGPDAGVGECGIVPEYSQIFFALGERAGDEQDSRRALLPGGHRLRAQRRERCKLAPRVISFR